MVYYYYNHRKTPFLYFTYSTLIKTLSRSIPAQDGDSSFYCQPGIKKKNMTLNEETESTDSKSGTATYAKKTK